MKYVLRYKVDAYITTTAFSKPIAHTYDGIRVIQQVIQYKKTQCASGFFKFDGVAFVISDVQIYHGVQLFARNGSPFNETPYKSSPKLALSTDGPEVL